MAFDQILATIGLAVTLIALVPQIAWLLSRNRRDESLSGWLLLLGGVVLFGAILARSLKIGFPAVTNTYEALIFFSASVLVAAAVLMFRGKGESGAKRWSLFGATVIALALLALSSSPLLGKDINPPIPALNSYWLVLHVTLAFIGEAFFAISFIAAIVYFFMKDAARRSSLDRLMYTTIMIGYPIFTVGALVFGAIWAEYAWGSYWTWDPKETWALITWLVYTAFLHTRLIMKLKGTVSATLSIAGFLFTVFTFAGVNYLLSGLHSYGG